MSMNADTIEKIVIELLVLKDQKSKEELDEQFLEFRTKNRMFYETILNGQFDPVIFKEMMKRKRELESGKDQYSVDVKFGQYMADKYINPVINKDKK
jgi:hypothetical protein